MRRNVAIVAGSLLLIGLAAYAVTRLASPHNATAATVAAKPATCTDSYRVLKLAPSEVRAADPVCLVQSLQLSGQVVGEVAEAYTVSQDGVAATSMCIEPKRWSRYPQALLAFVAGGKAYRLRISAPGDSQHQLLKISDVANVVDLASISDPSQDWNQATGTVTLNPDGVTGSIDVKVLQDVNGAVPVDVIGHWACGAPLPLPAFAASAPCANFYALNQLRVGDVARMKARACHPESLTFSGDISAHLKNAVTDRSIAPSPGYGGDNYCGNVGEQYTATLKFSIGDESFLLDLGANQYQGVTPGRYTAGFGNSIGVDLFLGYADPDNHGEFVTDDRVLWLGASGSFTIARDMKSGTVDATVSGLGGTSASSVQIKGSWRCAA